MPGKALAEGAGTVPMWCGNELCAASSRTRWAFLGMVTSKSLVSSCTIGLQGRISVSVIKGDQTSSGCFFYISIFYF